MTTTTPPFSPKERIVELAGTGCRLFTQTRSMSMRAASPSYGADSLTSIGAGVYVDKIFAVKPADLTQQPPSLSL
jgi:hypothetical protein